MRRATLSGSSRATVLVFLSTLSLRRATLSFPYMTLLTLISIHALLAESDSITGYFFNAVQIISIHALLAESDYRAPPYNLMIQHISIHALLAESDPICSKINTRGSVFLSTLSLRRATIGTLRTVSVRKTFLSTLSLRRATAPNHNPCPRSRNFYPRSPCGERRPEYFFAWHSISISIHALLAESDLDLTFHQR